MQAHHKIACGQTHKEYRSITRFRAALVCFGAVGANAGFGDWRVAIQNHRAIRIVTGCHHTPKSILALLTRKTSSGPMYCAAITV